ncbi:MAG: sulfite exporter TauE/SafE family protein [Candidatus Latescibacterota bacterium]|nr:MAG: sulfite exporter TauE/SafE family protein [Candidatus Latescibacterota bacterium]
MADYFWVSLSALWLGILTSVSPCPLATNIAAISFIGRRVESPREVLLCGTLYTVGRTITYVILGALLAYSLLSTPYVSHVLQKYMNKILGPILILVGMFLLDLIRVSWSGAEIGSHLEHRARKMGLWGAGLLGIGFALSFCPVSAALFFGSLLPLAVQSNSPVFLPLLYGVGTALPVVVFAIVISVSAHSLGKAFASVTLVERWARRITGIVFIGVGIYFTVVYIFGFSF